MQDGWTDTQLQDNAFNNKTFRREMARHAMRADVLN
jgi:hypothetical protein